jgi:uncharacterized protein
VRRVLISVVSAAILVGAALPAWPQGLDPGLDLPVTGDEDGDFDVLVFTRTTGFRHTSIPNGILLVDRLGREHGFGVEHTEDPDAFTDDELGRFATVIWLNTTGDVLDDDGRAAFERYVRGGGAWVGIHSAADTEYDWPFYGELLGGAWFHSHPIQQSGTFHIEAPDHPSTAHLPDPWEIPFEEYYSFVDGPRPHVRVLMNIDEDSYDPDPNTTHLPEGPEAPEGESGVMGDHPMAWCHDVGDGHAWYTALGHEAWLYEDPDFQRHVLGGILTAAGEEEADCDPEADHDTDAADRDPGTAEDAGTDRTRPERASTPRPLPATGAGLAVGVVLLLGAVIVRKARS